jgi:hypothetical protein
MAMRALAEQEAQGMEPHCRNDNGTLRYWTLRFDIERSAREAKGLGDFQSSSLRLPGSSFQNSDVY